MPEIDETLEHHYQQYTSYTHYELSNHLGNVMATITDHKTLVIDNGISHYEAVVISATDYYPFGWVMPGRKIEGEFRFGFQGQEGDHEPKGYGASWNYKFRMYDARVGRFFATDPLAAKYVYNSPYAFNENRLVDGVELEGLEVHLFVETKGTGHTFLTIGSIDDIEVWSFGRYGNTGSLGFTGEGILLKKTGSSAK